MKPLFNRMLGITSSILLLSGCQAMQHNSMQPNISAQPTGMVPSSTNTQTVADNTTLIITYEAGKKANALQAVTAMQGKIVYDYKNLNMLAVAFDTTDIEAVRHQLEQQPGILTVQRNQQAHTLGQK